MFHLFRAVKLLLALRKSDDLPAYLKESLEHPDPAVRNAAAKQARKIAERKEVEIRGKLEDGQRRGLFPAQVVHGSNAWRHISRCHNPGCTGQCATELAPRDLPHLLLNGEQDYRLQLQPVHKGPYSDSATVRVFYKGHHIGTAHSSKKHHDLDFGVDGLHRTSTTEHPWDEPTYDSTPGANLERAHKQNYNNVVPVPGTENINRQNGGHKRIIYAAQQALKRFTSGQEP